MDRFLHPLADLLLAIEAEMRRSGIWENTSPPDHALESLAPFCHDTLTLPQWLQWVFLPKMKQALENEVGMPASSDITPLAEYSFARVPQNTARLLELLRQFDDLINRGA